MPKINIKIPHVVSVVVMAGVGAFIGYFSQQNPGSVIVALTHWSSAEPMLAGGFAAALATVLPLIQHSILVWETPPPPAGNAVPIEAKVVTIPAVPPAPTRNEMGRLFRMPRFVFAAPFVAALALLVLLPGCTPAQGANVSNILPTVLADLVAGKTIPQIEQDVGKLLDGAVGSDIVAAVQDAVTFLVDAGLIPPSVLPYAKSVQGAERVKLALRAASQIVPAVQQ